MAFRCMIRSKRCLSCDFMPIRSIRARTRWALQTRTRRQTVRALVTFKVLFRRVSGWKRRLSRYFMPARLIRTKKQWELRTQTRSQIARAL